MYQISANDLQNLVKAQFDIKGCAYRNTPGNNRVDYFPEATAQQKVIGNAIAEQFLQATISTDKVTIAADGVEFVTISATVDNADTEAIVTVFGSDGEIDFEDTISVVNGECSYPRALPIADVYKIRVYGTISYMSNYIKVVAT